MEKARPSFQFREGGKERRRAYASKERRRKPALSIIKEEKAWERAKFRPVLQGEGERTYLALPFRKVL